MIRHRTVGKFDRTEKMLFVGISLLVGSIFGIYGLLYLYHSSTSAQVAASNCVTAKCESPAVKAIIVQAVSALGIALSNVNKPNTALLCVSLMELNRTSPQASASDALARYCKKG